MAIASLYCLRAYEVMREEYFLYLSGLSISLALLTKYSVIPLVFAVPLYLVIQKKFRATFIISFTVALTFLPWLIRSHLLFNNIFYFLAEAQVTSGMLVNWLLFEPYVRATPLIGLIRTYFEFWGIPEGNYSIILNMSRLAFVAYAVLTLSFTLFLLRAALQGIKKERASPMALLLVSVLLFKFAIWRLGSEVYFRYMFLIIIPLAYFAGITLSKMTKRQQTTLFSIYLMLALIVLPKFIIAREQFNELEQMVSHIEAQGKPVILESDQLSYTLAFYFKTIHFKELTDATVGDLLLFRKPVPDLPPDSLSEVHETDNYALFKITSV